MLLMNVFCVTAAKKISVVAIMELRAFLKKRFTGISAKIVRLAVRMLLLGKVMLGF